MHCPFPLAHLFINRPNSLTGSISNANAFVTTPATSSVDLVPCDRLDVIGPAKVQCSADFSDLKEAFIILRLECPAGQIAIQSGCISTGPQAITGMVQTQTETSISTAQCFINLPASGTYSASISATCVTLTITSDTSGKALEPSFASMEDARAKFAGARRRRL